MRKIYFVLPLVVAIIFTACKKDDDEKVTAAPTSQEMLTNFSDHVVLATYADLELRGDSLKSKVAKLNANPSADNLAAARDAWKATRESWERSEAFLFGPTSTQNLDPGIDTWPVNQTDLDQLLASSDAFTDTYIDALTDDGLRGFHPLEYMLWGANGTKAYTDFTVREKEYMVAMASYIERVTNSIYDNWNPAVSTSYYYDVINAGVSTNVEYPTKLLAFEAIVNSMAGICDEVANGKIEEPYAAHDANLEESQFSHNSLTDFRNNIISVQNAYLGGYNTTQDKSLSAWVAKNNASLDQRIKDKITASIAALDAITGPFGTAVATTNIQIETAQDRINELEVLITDELLPLVQSRIQ